MPISKRLGKFLISQLKKQGKYEAPHGLKQKQLRATVRDISKRGKTAEAKKFYKGWGDKLQKGLDKPHLMPKAKAKPKPRIRAKSTRAPRRK